MYKNLAAAALRTRMPASFHPSVFSWLLRLTVSAV